MLFDLLKSDLDELSKRRDPLKTFVGSIISEINVIAQKENILLDGDLCLRVLDRYKKMIQENRNKLAEQKQNTKELDRQIEYCDKYIPKPIVPATKDEILMIAEEALAQDIPDLKYQARLVQAVKRRLGDRQTDNKTVSWIREWLLWKMTVRR